jgi:hypothetical protein
MEFELRQATEVLATTPAVLDGLLRGKSPEWLNARRAADSFNAVDVLGHMIYGEMTDWTPRVHIILKTQDREAFEPFDRFGFRPLIAGKTVDELLDRFAVLRREGLAELRGLRLTKKQLELPGLHPELGPVTLKNLLASWVVHDLGHIAQIVKTMAGECRDAVGPWRAYTSILD